MASILQFPDRSTILINRADAGGFMVEPYLCPRAAGRERHFSRAGDALDYAEVLAREAGTGSFVMCDLAESDVCTTITRCAPNPIGK